MRRRRVEGVANNLIYHLKQLLDQIQEWLNPRDCRLRLGTLQIHDCLQAQYCVVLVFDSHQLHQCINHVQRIRFDFRRAMLESVEAFKDLVPQDMFIRDGIEVRFAFEYLLEHRP